MSDAREVGAAHARSLVESGEAKLIDVREQDEWDRGHSPVASLIPMSTIDERLGDVPSDTPLMIVCHSGVRSARVATALIAAGFDASNVVGGMIAWEATGADIVAEGGQSPTVG